MKATDDTAAERELRNAFNSLDDKTKQKINWPSENLQQEMPGLNHMFQTAQTGAESECV